MIPQDSPLWEYFSETQRMLARDGQFLLKDRADHPDERLSDYSYLVFPFAKLYEGFLKRLFRDTGIIGDREYQSEHFRLGKVLSPNLVRRLRDRSAYRMIADRYGTELAVTLWQTWKEGRNTVFHYFPHNVRRLNFPEAEAKIVRIIDTMTEAVARMRPRHLPSKTRRDKSSIAWGIGGGVS